MNQAMETQVLTKLVSLEQEFYKLKTLIVKDKHSFAAVSKTSVVDKTFGMLRSKPVDAVHYQRQVRKAADTRMRKLSRLVK